jgi:hypothetical protein
MLLRSLLGSSGIRPKRGDSVQAHRSPDGDSGSRRPAMLCDHEGVPRGTATRWKTRYSVRLTVPRRDGWRAWGTVRADFESALADRADRAVAAAEIASEHRRGPDYVRVTVVLVIAAANVADALTIAWEAFTSAAGNDLTGWEIPGAAAEVQPEPPLPSQDLPEPGCKALIGSAVHLILLLGQDRISGLLAPPRCAARRLRRPADGSCRETRPPRRARRAAGRRPPRRTGAAAGPGRQRQHQRQYGRATQPAHADVTHQSPRHGRGKSAAPPSTAGLSPFPSSGVQDHILVPRAWYLAPAAAIRASSEVCAARRRRCHPDKEMPRARLASRSWSSSGASFMSVTGALLALLKGTCHQPQRR